MPGLQLLPFLSLTNGQNSGRSISNLRISGQSLIKENCQNSRTSDDIDMKPRHYQGKPKGGTIYPLHPE